MSNKHIFSKLINTLKQKKECLTDILILTKNADFNGIEEEIPRFIEYIEERQKILDVCKEIDMDLNELTEKQNINELKKDELYKDIELIENEISKLASQIILLDKPINDKMNIVFNKIKSEVNTINNGKQLRKGYFSYHPTSGATFFDKKN